MASDKDSIILSDVSINGDIVEKEKLIFNGKLNGDINADEVETHANSYIKGNIKAAKTSFENDWEVFISITVPFTLFMTDTVFTLYRAAAVRINSSDESTKAFGNFVLCIISRKGITGI